MRIMLHTSLYVANNLILIPVFIFSPEAFINLADAKYIPIQKHPHQLLETYLCHLGHNVFPCAKGNVNHPILVIDRYISLGTEVCINENPIYCLPDLEYSWHWAFILKVYVEYACSKPGALPWAVDSEKTYSGLLLYCQSSEISLSFLQQFKFTGGRHWFDSDLCGTW